jgi:hypothetical protein
MKLINFFFVKKLRMEKGKIFPKFFFGKLCFLWSRYGTGTVTCQKSELEP